MWGGGGIAASLAAPSSLTPPLRLRFWLQGQGPLVGQTGPLPRPNLGGAGDVLGGGAFWQLFGIFSDRMLSEERRAFLGGGLFWGGCEDGAASRQLKSMRSPRRVAALRKSPSFPASASFSV